MIHYASQLASASHCFLASMEADPSALGVSAAFLSVEEVVEGAFVGWCGVVGGWFQGSGGSNRRDSSASSNSSSKGRSEEDIHVTNTLRRRKEVLTMTGLSDPVSPTPSFKSSFSWRKDKDRLSINNTNNIKKTPVRDLAILPTQRIVRYVLLYRDLLALTPSTSPSRALVERAVEAATRIAQKCDRAQDNSAFLIDPSLSSRPSTARSTRPRANSKIFLTRSRKSSTA
jgi:hypothetical protein